MLTKDSPKGVSGARSFATGCGSISVNLDGFGIGSPFKSIAACGQPVKARKHYRITIVFVKKTGWIHG